MDIAVATALPQLHRCAADQVIATHIPGGVPGTLQTPMQQANDKSKSNIRLALILGSIALGFFMLGLYLASGKAD